MAKKKSLAPKDQYETLLNLTPEDVMKRINKIKSVGNTIAFELGVLLRRVRDEQLWQDWEGDKYPSFAEWVFKVLGRNVRTAQYYIEVNEKLMALKLDEEWMRKAIQLGWVKLLDILKVAKNKTEFKKWYAKALNQGERSLRADIRAAFNQLPSEDDDKDEVELDEHGNPVHIPLSFHFDNTESWEHFSKALELAEQVVGTQKQVALLDHMATYYLAHASTHLEGGATMDIQDILLALKETYGMELAIQHPETEEWIPVRREDEEEEEEEASKKKQKKSPKKSSAKKKSSPKKKAPKKKGKKKSA